VVIPCLRAGSVGTEISVHVQPGASRVEIAGLHGDALKVRIHARAVEGAANEALLNFIAHALGVPRREVKIVRGEKSRRKVLEVQLPVEDVMEILARLMMTVGDSS
jgi:uncharacterized protein